MVLNQSTTNLANTVNKYSVDLMVVTRSLPVSSLDGEKPTSGSIGKGSTFGP